MEKKLEARLAKLEKIMSCKSVKNESIVDSRDANNLRKILRDVTRTMNKFDDQMELAARKNPSLRDWPAYDDFYNAVLDLQQAVKDLLSTSADPSI